MNFNFICKLFDYIWANLYNNVMKQIKKILKGRHTLIFVDFEGTQYTHEVIASGLLKCKIDDNSGFMLKQHTNGMKFVATCANG